MDAEDLFDEFTRQAEWRRQKAAEYPDDSRNSKAAQLLDALALSTARCPPEVFRAVEELYQKDGDNAAELWSQMMGDVGFNSAPKTAEEFCRDFISQMVLLMRP